MGVDSTEQLQALNTILYDRPAGRNIIGHAIDTIKDLRTKQDYLNRLYQDLLYQVVNKHPGETRHETARRIIKQHEEQQHSAQGGETP